MAHGLVRSTLLRRSACGAQLGRARAAGHVALALLSMTDGTYGGRRGLVALDAGGGATSRPGVAITRSSWPPPMAALPSAFSAEPRAAAGHAASSVGPTWAGAVPLHDVGAPGLDMRPLATLLLDTLVVASGSNRMRRSGSSSGATSATSGGVACWRTPCRHPPSISGGGGRT